jgi:GTP-binding protein Era
MTESPFRCGYAALVGRPNVGKSTLLNRLLGRKVSIVTPKAQTTRHRILGIDNQDGAQVVFVDTPGLHRGRKNALNRAMNKAASSSMPDADIVVFLTEALRWKTEDSDVLRKAIDSGRPVIAAVNKVDIVHPRERLLPFIEELAARAQFAAILPISAQKGSNVEALRTEVIKLLPENPAFFDPGQVTDRGEKFHCSEIIREKLMQRLHQELPYGLTVEIEKLEKSAKLARVSALIWVGRSAHKSIVIGKRGEQLKKCGQAARIDLEELLKQKVHLELWVRVRENWADNEKELHRLGFDVQ